MTSPFLELPKRTEAEVRQGRLGTQADPLRIEEIGTYPAEFADRPYIYVIPSKGKNAGQKVKWYRSYGDYCD